MIFESKNYLLTIIQEHNYSPSSSDNVNPYAKEYNLEPDYQASSVYIINCGDISNCVLTAGGGTSAVSSRTAVISDSKVWVGIGDQLVCLSLPSLEIEWHQKIDDATCFGLYVSPDGMGLLIHGELVISKITFSGGLIWSTSGKDIFTEGFSVNGNFIEAVDFNHENYRIEIANGQNILV
jgi:hypothetical protein